MITRTFLAPGLNSLIKSVNALEEEGWAVRILEPVAQGYIVVMERES